MGQPSIRRVEFLEARAGDPNLFRRSWLPEEPQRVLLIVHGFGEHSGRFEHVGAWFAGRGAAVHAYDQRGHGRSAGLRCHVGRFDEYLDDLAGVLDAAGDAHPGLPRYLVGHSMGGLICADFLGARKPALRGAILSAPALALERRGAGAQLLIARILRRIMPRKRMASPVDPEALSTDPEVVADYLADPLVHHEQMTLSLAAELAGTIARVRGADVEVPTLVLHGEEDRLCPISGSREFATQLPEGRLTCYPGLRHEIFNEPQQEAIFDDILGWIHALEGGAGGSA